MEERKLESPAKPGFVDPDGSPCHSRGLRPLPGVLRYTVKYLPSSEASCELADSRPHIEESQRPNPEQHANQEATDNESEQFFAKGYFGKMFGKWIENRKCLRWSYRWSNSQAQ